MFLQGRTDEYKAFVVSPPRLVESTHEGSLEQFAPSDCDCGLVAVQPVPLEESARARHDRTAFNPCSSYIVLGRST